jgi:16S rRNA (cytosine967-C5)-methyltransferase
LYIAQQIAARAVSQVLAGRNLNIALEAALGERAALEPQQRAAARDLSYGALRFYGESQALLAQLLQKPLADAGLHGLLLVALYQLNHDQAASHTVVDQAVKAAGASSKKPWAKSLVNGVLRNFLRRRELLMRDLVSNEAAQYSYPQWWIDKLRQQYPEHWQAMLMAGNAQPPMTLRVNRRQCSTAGYQHELAEIGIESRVLGRQALMLERPLHVDKLPGFAQGRVSVQDYGAQLAAELLDVQPGQRVLDACCAPGGKTGHVLELAEVAMTAVDSDAMRLERTRSNLTRLGLPAQLLVGDAATPAIWWNGQPYDRILADVPCTASGIVRRHVDIKWLRREADVAAFARQQATILHSLWQLLAKGGKLLYVTCSIFHEENQQQIDDFLGRQTGAAQLPLNLESGKTSLINQQQGQLRPCAEHDGFYYALLQKN